ncbi:MAG: inorganic diphosphatase [Phaeodactylibacter sp.]|nr:inorganic diphosphatase [Phaeodactylibacter sp.]
MNPIPARTTFYCLLIVLFGLSCSPPAQDYYHYPCFSGDYVNAVIEIPAGTNLKMEYHADRQAFLPDSIDGKVRYVNFLPYPANYGFIPSTYMAQQRGGDGDPLDIVVIAEALPSQSILETIPIATLRLLDDGEIDTKIIAVPADPKLRVIQATNYQDFVIHYDAARAILENWFLSYKGIGRTELLGWNDEAFALATIKQWGAEGADVPD